MRSPEPVSNWTSAPPSPSGSGLVAFEGAASVTPSLLARERWLKVLTAASNAWRHGLLKVGATKMVSCLGLRFLTLSSQGIAIAVPPVLGTASVAPGTVASDFGRKCVASTGGPFFRREREEGGHGPQTRSPP